MRNLVYETGNKLPYTNGGSSTITSGSVVVIGDLVGIASADIPPASTGMITLAGAFNLPKKAALAVTRGNSLYWSTADGVVTKTNTDKKLGHAFADAAGADAEVQVRLIQSI